MPSVADVTVVPEQDSVLWINPETGAIVDPETEGAVVLDKWDVATPEGNERGEDMAWLPGWYITRMDHLSAERATLKAQYDAMLKSIENREKYLKWKWSEVMAEIVTEKIEAAGGKKRSFDFLEGRAGFRTATRTEIADPEEALDYCRANVPEAVKITERMLVSKIPKGVKVPGVTVIKEDRFYVKGAN